MMKSRAEKALEKAAEQVALDLMKQLRGRTPDDTKFACATVPVPNTKQRVRVCVEPQWRSETREDPTTGAPVTVHISPEYTRKQVREAARQQIAEQQRKQLPPPQDAAKK